MIYLDTHVVVWLYSGLKNKFSQEIQELINRNQIFICPLVRLELQYLYEIKKISSAPDIIVTDLSSRIGLQVDNENFNNIVTEAMTISWTRDPFDRLIVANAAVNNSILVTKDRIIMKNYSMAKW